MSSHISAVFDLKIHLAVKTHLSLLGFFCGLCVFESKPADGWHVPRPKHSSTTLLPLSPWPPFSCCTQMAHRKAMRNQAKATMCGAISNQDLMAENLHYKTPNETCSFGSSLIWYEGLETVTHQLCGVRAAPLTYVPIQHICVLVPPRPFRGPASLFIVSSLPYYQEQTAYYPHVIFRNVSKSNHVLYWCW